MMRDKDKPKKGYTKGRLLKDSEREELSNFLGLSVYKREDLIEYLHLIQDEFHCVTYGNLHALADLLRIPMAETLEVASFYAHFDIISDLDDRLTVQTIRVCNSVTCHMFDSENLYNDLKESSASGYRVVKAPCMGRCDKAPVCEVNKLHIESATQEKVNAHINNDNYKLVIPNYINHAAYVKDSGYTVFQNCLNGTITDEQIISILKDANLRGLGGAGFPTGVKWEILLKKDGPKYLAVNADEGEPGTFKDKYYLENNPCSFIEGMLIAAWTVKAEKIYIYIRDEYPAALQILKNEIKELEKSGINKNIEIEIKRGAGSYVCGEESAMIESIEGKKGFPRHRPPYVADVGIFGKPTLVNNVETLYWIPMILKNGSEWFANKGINGSKGLRTYSVSGRVRNPGIKIVPAGVTANQLIDEYSGGILEDHEFTGYLPGGASGGILPSRLADIPLDFNNLSKYGCFVGSHAVVILSDADNIKDIAINLMDFFEHESCGQCTPCRVGTEKALNLMKKQVWDIELLNDLASVMSEASICGLGQAAPNPLLSIIKYFPELTNQ